MKNQPILYSLLLILPVDALAHPGHDVGAVAGGYIPILLALAIFGAAFAVRGICRRWRAHRADD